MASVFLRSARARGAWAKDNSARAREIAALRLGIELGMSLIDTAEMYGDGGAEEIVAEAIHGQQQRRFCGYESLSA